VVYTFALLIVVFSPDLSGYKDAVGVFPDAATCEKEGNYILHSRIDS